MTPIVGADHEFHDPEYAADWAGRFEPTPDRLALFDLMLSELRGRVPPHGRIVELGIGPGYLAAHLLDALPDARYQGLDFSRPMLDIAARRLQRHAQRAAFTQANLLADGWWKGLDGPVDAIVSTWALHDLGGPAPGRARLRRLREGPRQPRAAAERRLHQAGRRPARSTSRAASPSRRTSTCCAASGSRRPSASGCSRRSWRRRPPPRTTPASGPARPPAIVLESNGVRGVERDGRSVCWQKSCLFSTIGGNDTMPLRAVEQGGEGRRQRWVHRRERCPATAGPAADAVAACRKGGYLTGRAGEDRAGGGGPASRPGRGAGGAGRRVGGLPCDSCATADWPPRRRAPRRDGRPGCRACRSCPRGRRIRRADPRGPSSAPPPSRAQRRRRDRRP